MGGKEWTPPYADVVVKDGDEIATGPASGSRPSTRPGHTPEHVSWALYDDTRSKDTPWLLFTGDFLFVGDVGRPDLLGDEQRAALAHQLYESVFEMLPGLPDFTEIFPGPRRRLALRQGHRLPRRLHRSATSGGSTGRSSRSPSRSGPRRC